MKIDTPYDLTPERLDALIRERDEARQRAERYGKALREIASGESLLSTDIEGLMVQIAKAALADPQPAEAGGERGDGQDHRA